MCSAAHTTLRCTSLGYAAWSSLALHLAVHLDWKASESEKGRETEGGEDVETETDGVSSRTSVGRERAVPDEQRCLGSLRAICETLLTNTRRKDQLAHYVPFKDERKILY